MNTKLTLTIERKLIEKAKRYAKGRGRSLSDIIENYLKVIIREDDKTIVETTPIVNSMRGSYRATSRFDYRDHLISELSEKYLKNG